MSVTVKAQHNIDKPCTMSSTATIMQLIVADVGEYSKLLSSACFCTNIDAICDTAC
jgi:hypothetical protein